MNSCATCRLNSMLWERCLAMAFILRKPSSPCQITKLNLSGPRGALHNCDFMVFPPALKMTFGLYDPNMRAARAHTLECRGTRARNSSQRHYYPTRRNSPTAQADGLAA